MIFKNIKLGLIIGTSLVLFSCAGKMYEGAKLQDTSSGYKEYLEKYPEHKFAQNAENRINELKGLNAWAKVNKNSIDSINAFLNEGYKLASIVKTDIKNIVTPMINEKIKNGDVKFSFQGEYSNAVERELEKAGIVSNDTSNTLCIIKSSSICKNITLSSQNGVMSGSCESMNTMRRQHGALPYPVEEEKEVSFKLRLSYYGIDLISLSLPMVIKNSSFTQGEDLSTTLTNSFQHKDFSTFIVTQAYLDSVNNVNIQKYGSYIKKQKGKRWARRLIFVGLAAGTIGGGIYMDNEVEKSVDKQKSIVNNYENQKSNIDFDYYQNLIDHEDEKVELNSTRRNILYSLGALFSIGFVISIPF